MHSLDFSSLHALVTTLLSLAVITLIGVGIRLLSMVTIQQRRERLNRQINERLRALIAAYKTLGGSFTGDLSVDPTHRRDLHRPPSDGSIPAAASEADGPGADRARRVRDAVEAALSDIILLGTEEQVRMAANAAHELAAGRVVPTQDLVTSLRDFIREALDLDPIPADLTIPPQGPARPSGPGGRDKADKGDKGEGRQGGGGGGMGMGGGVGLGSGSHRDNEDDEEEPGTSLHSSA